MKRSMVLYNISLFCPTDLYLRYMTIVRPRSPHLSLPGTTASLAVVWSTSVMVAIPTLLYSTTVSYGEEMQRQRQACIMIWPDGDPRLDSSSQTVTRNYFLSNEPVRDNEPNLQCVCTGPLLPG